MRLESIDNEFQRHRDAVVDVYRAAYTPAPHCATEEGITTFAESWSARCAEQDFRLVLAHLESEAGDVAGLAYGYTPAATSDWYTVMAEKLGGLTQFWLDGCFSCVDVAVKPSAQRRGVGTALCETLLSDVSNRTALLYIQGAESGVLQMYTKLGWQVIRDEMSLSSGQHRVLMGKVLHPAG